MSKRKTDPCEKCERRLIFLPMKTVGDFVPIACRACARAAMAERDAREAELYAEAEFACVQQVSSFSNHDWELGFIHDDRLRELGPDAAWHLGCRLAEIHDYAWLASEERRIFGRANG